MRKTKPPAPRVKAAPKRHYLDRRADQLLESATDSDELMTSRDLAAFLSVSETWVEIGRLRGYGPKFTRLSPKMIRYRKADVLAWLEQRMHASTKEYAA